MNVSEVRRFLIPSSQSMKHHFLYFYVTTLLKFCYLNVIKCAFFTSLFYSSLTIIRYKYPFITYRNHFYSKIDNHGRSKFHLISTFLSKNVDMDVFCNISLRFPLENTCPSFINNVCVKIGDISSI